MLEFDSLVHCQFFGPSTLPYHVSDAVITYVAIDTVLCVLFDVFRSAAHYFEHLQTPLTD